MGGDTGNSNGNSIGHFFERIILSNFEGLSKSEGSRLPDFKGDGFWLEAKVGFKKHGPHVHDFQWWYTKLDDPVYYAFGYHNLDNVKERMGHYKTDRGRSDYLSREMHVENIYFLPLGIVQKIYEKEKGKGPKGRESDLVLHSSIPKNIITGREFRRNGETVTPEGYYDYDPLEFTLHSSQNKNKSHPLVHMIDHPYARIIDSSYAYIVRKSDKAFIDFLDKNHLWTHSDVV